MARWLFGPLELLHAAAAKLSRLEIETEDTALLTLGPRPLVSIALDYVSRRRVRRYEVVGDEASLIWDLERAVLERVDASGTRVLASGAAEFDVGASYLEALKEFLAARPSCGLMDGLESAELALQAREKATACAS
jgi:predicted dehydrogenase